MPGAPSNSDPRAARPVKDELAALLAARGWSRNELARRVGVDPTFLSRALRGVRYKSINGQLAARIASTLGLPEDYFLETRRDYLVERLDGDPELLEAAYRWIRRRERAR